MTDNEKAAIAAGLWEPGKRCEYAIPRDGQVIHEAPCGEKLYGGCGWAVHAHDIAAPDMHDPVNLWRALMQVNKYFEVRFGVTIEVRSIVDIVVARDTDFTRALVALYNAEHP